MSAFDEIAGTAADTIFDFYADAVTITLPDGSAQTVKAIIVRDVLPRPEGEEYRINTRRHEISFRQPAITPVRRAIVTLGDETWTLTEAIEKDGTVTKWAARYG